MSSPSSGPVVGVLGGGQLGRMLGLAGAPMGVRFRFLDPNPDACARDAGELIVAGFEDPDALRALTGIEPERTGGAPGPDRVDRVTFEFESVPIQALEACAARVPAHPNTDALRVTRDRRDEREFLESIGAGVADWMDVSSRADVERALERWGDSRGGAVLKTRRLGYDGKGQAVVRASADIDRAWDTIGSAAGDPDTGVIAEQLVGFDRELSIVGARSGAGETRFYPLVENIHERGILSRTVAPAPGVDADLRQEAEGILGAAMDKLGYVGVMTAELFQIGGKLLVNELAPRVHNSGHWTIEGAQTSQFEQHLRAILGWPLGPTGARGHAQMLNLVGATVDPARVPSEAGGCRVCTHIYGKAVKPGRKVGHVTVVGETHDATDRAAREVEGLLGERVVLG